MIKMLTNFNGNITLNDSGWLAIRAEGAHGKQVFINFKERPAGMSEPAERFIEITEQFEEWVNIKGLFILKSKNRKYCWYWKTEKRFLGKWRENLIDNNKEIKHIII